MTDARARPKLLRPTYVVPQLLLPIAVIAIVAAVADAYIQSIAVLILIAAMGAMALTVLMGVAGQPSLLTGALLLAGGYSAATFTNGLHVALPVTLVCTFLVGALIGVIAGLPAFRLTGIYLLLSTFAAQAIASDLGDLVQTHKDVTAGYFLKNPELFGYKISSPGQWVVCSGVFAFLTYHYLQHLLGTRVGRSWNLIREAGDGASRIVGVNSGRYVIYAFAVTSGITAVAGMLLAFDTQNVSYDGFDLFTAVSYIVMIVIGGTGRLTGAILGAIFVTALPYVLSSLYPTTSSTSFISTNLSYIELLVYGVIGVLVLVFLPDGIVGGVTALRQTSKDLWIRISRASEKRAAPAVDADSVDDHPDSVLRVRNVSVHYRAGETGLSDVSVDLRRRGVLAILGRNGAGKTTLLHSIVGFPPGSGGRLTSGRIDMAGRNGRVLLSKLDTASRVRQGLGFVPAEDKVFKSLSVREHLNEALAAGRRSGGKARSIEEAILRFPVLTERLDAAATSLSGGERQQLALAVALARNTQLLVVDEVSLGLSPIAVSTVSSVLRGVRDSGRSLVLVEQSPPVGFALADSIVLLEGGRVSAVGDPTPELQQLIDSSYLGVGRIDEAAAAGRPPIVVERPARRVPTTQGSDADALRLENVSVTVGGVRALTDVSLSLRLSHSVGLIGPNGAGKTSLLNVVCGHYPALRGSIFLGDNDVTNLKSNRIVGAGVGRTFQSPGQLVDLTVREFVQLGFEGRWREPVIATLVGYPAAARAERRFYSESDELLVDAELAPYADTPLGRCPYGIRKMADIVRAIAGQPQVLLLDEPSSGVSMADRPRIADLIRRYQHTSGASLLLVDHDVDFVAGLCPDLVVLSNGRVVASGARDLVLADPKVIETFIGIANPRDNGDGPPAAH